MRILCLHLITHTLSLWIAACAHTTLARNTPSYNAPLTGSVELDEDYTLSWNIEDGADSKAVRFNLTWNSKYDWSAFGLHDAPGQGMIDAEIFMCRDGGCEVRYASGYTTPSLVSNQYISDVTTETGKDGRTRASFLRERVVSGVNASVAIENRTQGLIYASGMWDASNKQPLQHPDGTQGRLSINFFVPGKHPSPAPPTPPTPTPSPPNPSHKAGIWPQRFDARLTIAPSQPPSSQLRVELGSRIRYDFPSRSQLWEFWDITDSSATPTYAELWINETLYEIDRSTNPPGCSATQIDLEILRPDWMVHTTYVGTHFLLRQPNASAHSSSSSSLSCYAKTYQLADLFQDPAPIGGMTNNWVVANSSIAEPVRLEGPDDFSHPTWLTVQEYSQFLPVQQHEPETFAIPSTCPTNTTRRMRIRDAPLMMKYRPQTTAGAMRKYPRGL